MPKGGKNGRPTDYREDYNEQVYAFALLGLTDAEMASNLGVSESTFNLWKLKNPKFSESLNDGKEKADSKIAKKLHERAEGYEWTEEVPMKVKDTTYDDKGKRLRETERIEIVNVTRRVPPDPTSALFWLKNRKSDKWRDKRDVDVLSGGKTISMIGAILDGLEHDERGSTEKAT